MLRIVFALIVCISPCLLLSGCGGTNAPAEFVPVAAQSEAELAAEKDYEKLMAEEAKKYGKKL